MKQRKEEIHSRTSIIKHKNTRDPGTLSFPFSDSHLGYVEGGGGGGGFVILTIKHYLALGD